MVSRVCRLRLSRFRQVSNGHRHYPDNSGRSRQGARQHLRIGSWAGLDERSAATCGTCLEGTGAWTYASPSEVLHFPPSSLVPDGQDLLLLCALPLAVPRLMRRLSGVRLDRRWESDGPRLRILAASVAEGGHTMQKIPFDLALDFRCPDFASRRSCAALRPVEPALCLAPPKSRCFHAPRHSVICLLILLSAPGDPNLIL